MKYYYTDNDNELVKNAINNNTFNLDLVESNIKHTMYNSFNYLKELQRSYFEVYRTTLHTSDLFISNDRHLCFSVDKDYVNQTQRKEYRESKYYNKYITPSDISRNIGTIFEYMPIVILDGYVITSYTTKTTLSGDPIFKFNHIAAITSFMYEDVTNKIYKNHTLEIIYLKNCKYYIGITSSSNLPSINMGSTLNDGTTVLYSVRNINSTLSSKLYYGKVLGNYLTISTSNMNEIRSDLITLDDNVKLFIDIFKPSNIVEISELKDIKPNRISNKNTSSVCISTSEDGINTYNMPIPEQNLFVFKHDVDECVCYSNDVNVSLHYPNIYEIECSSYNSGDKYKVFYFYDDVQGHLKYMNIMKYIYKYFMYKCNKSNVEDVVKSFLYTSENTSLLSYFTSIYNYEDNQYIYNIKDLNGDNGNEKHFDYKINKMKTFISYNPYVLKKYGKEVATTSTRYFLHIPDVLQDDPTFLNNKIKVKCINGTDTSVYEFIFSNEFYRQLQIRFFIDGLLYTNYYQESIDDVDMIYIPIKDITDESHIEIEVFNMYEFAEEIEFKSTATEYQIDFDKSSLVQPTLFDLLVFDSTGKQVDINNFTIKNISDDPESNNTYTMNIDFTNIDDLRYTLLKSIKIKCNTLGMLGKYRFVINKIPYLMTEYLNTTGLTSIEFFEGKIPWRADKSYIRTFINGKYIPFEYDIITDKNNISRFNSHTIIKAGNTLTVDVTPFSYTLVYDTKEIDDSGIIEFTNLSRPFDLYYYDVYLNGTRLFENNIQVISPTKIRIYNVKSTKNLYIYQRDRDIEYFKPEEIFSTKTDELLNEIPDDELVETIDIILGVTTPPPVNDEDDIFDLYGNDSETYQELIFYMDKILPRATEANNVSPNNFYLDKNEIEKSYDIVYNLYSNKSNRIVLKPNQDPYANKYILIGRSGPEVSYKKKG